MSSALSARVTSADVTKLLGDAVNLLRAKYPGEDFPLLKDDDPDTVMAGGYLAIEGKNILIAAITGDVWEELQKKNRRLVLKKPSECPAGYRLSSENWWPEDSSKAGLVGMALDKQANVVADLGFTRLMYLKSKGASKAHAELFKKAARNDDDDDDDNEDEDTDMVDPDETTPIEDLLPAAWSVNSSYRLTCDWEKWPSAGQLPNEVSNIRQAQYGVVADMIFEAMKVEIRLAKAKTGRKIVGEKNKDAQALANDEGALTVFSPLLLAFKSSGGKIYKGASVNAPDAAAKFVKFCMDNKNDFTMTYRNDVDEECNFVDELGKIPSESYTEFFIRAGKNHSTYQSTTRRLEDQSVADSAASVVDDNSMADVSIADSMSIYGDGSVLDAGFETAPLPAPGPNNNGLGRGGATRGRVATSATPGRAVSRGRGGTPARAASSAGGRGGTPARAASSARGRAGTPARGRGAASAAGPSAARGGAAVAGPSTGTKRGHEAIADDDEDDEDEDDDDMASIGGPAPKRAR